MFSIFKKLKYRYLEFTIERAVKVGGYRSIRDYVRSNDPDFSGRDSTIRGMYKGYPFVTPLMPVKLSMSGFRYLDSFDWVKELEGWCMTHCRDKFRIQYERVIENYKGDWDLNGICGYDEVFFGFKNRDDFVLFKLSHC